MVDPELFPASGAWMPGDEPGHRRFHTIATDHPFALDHGGRLHDVVIAYETWGELDATASNAVLVCHAWTGDSHVAGPAGPGHRTPGWWEGIVGPGLSIDTDRYFVVCANVLGGCQGSTGPSSIDPDSGRPYGATFPMITVRDMVRVQARLTDHLGIETWLSVLGGSAGGMQVLEWAITFPGRVRSIVPIATCAQATAQQIAWGGIGRRAIRLDPRWRGGEYYDAAPGDGPHEGLAIARMVAQVTFRSDNVFTDRFGRDLADGDHDEPGSWPSFEVERYLDHHGAKLVRRFDANSYLVIGMAMDLHDIAKGRGGVEAAIGRIRAPTLILGITSDMLYPMYQQRQIHHLLARQGTPTEFVEIDSPHGHDSFLIDVDRVGEPIGAFLDEVTKSP